MPNEKYVSPEMDIIEFGNDDVCTASVNTTDYTGSTTDGPGGIGGWDGSSQPET